MPRLLYLAPCAVVLAACGGTSATSTGPGPIVSAAEKTRRAGSERMAMTANVTLAGGQSLTLKGAGSFDQATGRGELYSRFTAANGESTTLDEIFAGNRMWLRSPLFGNIFPPGKSWLELDLATSARKVDFDFKGLTGEDPADVLTELQRTSRSVTKAGTERVGGIEMTQYRAAIDPAKVPRNDVIERLTGAEYEPVDAWVDSTGLLRKVQLDYTAKTDPSKPARAHIVLDMTFSSYGAKVTATPPPADETIDAAAAGKVGG